jgi:adenylate cyclase class 2
MNTEIEAKFINVNHDEIRDKLKEFGAVLEQPKRLMRRVVIHTPEMTTKNAFLRVRDEGYRTTITYKQFDGDTVDGAKEHEVEVSSFDEAINILSASGLAYDTYQESKRENWRLGDVEIMLDEWPWLNPYIEIEGKSEQAIQEVAQLLGFEWSDAVFGGVANVYKKQYPYIGDEGNRIINQEWPTIKFNDPAPDLLRNPGDS